MTKLVRSNGRELRVLDVRHVMTLRVGPGGEPLPLTDEEMTDDAARALLKTLLATGRYAREDAV